MVVAEHTSRKIGVVVEDCQLLIGCVPIGQASAGLAVVEVVIAFLE